MGVTTTDDLLRLGATRKGREELTEQTGLSHKLILAWVNRADLMRVPGLGEEYSDLLELAGVDTVKELRRRSPENLHKRMLAKNEQHKVVRRVPTLNEVTAWIEAAKEIEATPDVLTIRSEQIEEPGRFPKIHLSGSLFFVINTFT